MTGSNPTDRSKIGQAKRHILTDKKGIPLSAVITSAGTHDIKAVMDVIDNAVIKRRPYLLYFTKKKRRKMHHQHLCLDRAYNSKLVRQETIKRGYILIYRIKEKEERTRLYAKINIKL